MFVTNNQPSLITVRIMSIHDAENHDLAALQRRVAQLEEECGKSAALSALEGDPPG